MTEDKKQNNIIKFRKKPITLNLGIFIFGFIFVYLLVVFYSFATSSHIAGYEVKEGSLAVNNTYRGVAMRSEELFTCNDSGYINYYARESERVPKGAMIYTVDESGKLNDLLLADYDTSDTLTSADMNELKTDIINYKNSYNDYNFASLYDFKFNVEGTVNKLANQNILISLSQISDKSVLDLVNFDYSQDTGIVVYSYDGLENITATDISTEIFDEELHPRIQLQSNALIDNGDVAYKLVTEENWSIAIKIDEDRYNELLEESYVQVRFLKTGDVSWGKVNLIDREGEYFCKLDFTNSMINYATDRYIDIELLLTPQRGLKIPNSAIVEKDFYLVPASYLMNGDNDNEEQGFIRETYLEDGSLSTEFVPAQVYYQADDQCYIDVAVFRLGDYIVSPSPGGDKYAIGPKASLIGVYNMNKGYADFSQITIKYKNREYAIVESDTKYGLVVYDHIVLDGSSVNDDDFVFE